MSTLTATKSEIKQVVDSLPSESLAELKAFLAFLQFKSSQPRNISRLGGLWRDLPSVSEETISDLRQEMWSSFGERDI